jgi:hypothetical protein
VDKVPRAEAEAALAALRAVRPLYRDLRPAFTQLDALISLLERRGFSGGIWASGDPGEGALWFDRGVLRGAWWLPPGEAEATVHLVGPAALDRIDPMDVLRMFWEEGEAAVAVYPGIPPASMRSGGPGQEPTGAAQRPVEPPAPPRRRRWFGLAGPGDGQRGDVPSPASVASIPWTRLLADAVNRVRRHRGGQVARRLEEAVNAEIQPAALKGGKVVGVVSVAQGAAALSAVIANLNAVAGRTFVRQLFERLGEEHQCAEALRALLDDPALLTGLHPAEATAAGGSADSLQVWEGTTR